MSAGGGTRKITINSISLYLQYLQGIYNVSGTDTVLIVSVELGVSVNVWTNQG